MRRVVARLTGDAAWLIRNDARGSIAQEDRQVRRVRLYTVGSIVSLILLGVGLGVWIAVLAPDVLVLSSLALLALSGFTGTRLVLHVTAVGDRDWRAYRGHLVQFALPWVAGLLVAVLAPSQLSEALVPSFLLVAYGTLGGLRVTWVWVVLVALTAAAIFRTPMPWWQGLLFLIVLSAMLWAFRMSFWVYDLVGELRRRRQDTAALAVAEERLRFARDLHDVMGRQLSAIAVTADLATTLSRRGDDRAQEQMDQVRTLAHDSLSEMRALVRGYREIDLTTEMAGSRSLLQAAGIELTDQLTHEHIPPQAREVAAWTLREGITNILRHSRATRVLVRTTPGSLELRNDGAPSDTPLGPSAEDRGAGLAGLRERLEGVGGSLTIRTKPGQFSLLAEFDTDTDSDTDSDTTTDVAEDAERTTNS